MKVRNIMTSKVEACRPDTDLGAVVRLMWDRDCGFIPVVDAAGSVVGVVTDRDICVASATRGLLPQHISAAQAMSRPVHACLPDDDISDALATMRKFQLRRLPVVGPSGALRGVLSMNDIVLASERSKGPTPKEIVSALAAICAPRSLRSTAA